MAGNTILLHFQVDRTVLKKVEKTQTDLFQILDKYIGDLSLVKSMVIGEGFLTLYKGPQRSFVTVRGFAEGMISVNIEYFRKEKQRAIIDSSRTKDMVNDIAEAVGAKKYDNLPPLYRGPDCRYEMTVDERRIIENDIDKIIFSEKSPYQEVIIAHSPSFGNMLYIDGWINHSCADSIYTETLIQRGKEDYHGKEILVLGGGDGSTLWELLKEEPKSVLMVDIDETVIRASGAHLREVNGGVFDNMKGPNHEIIIGDCVKYLKKFIEEGRRFDYVFGCLTEFPYSEEGTESEAHESVWCWLANVINLSFRVLKPSGKYMSHCAMTMIPKILRFFEDNTLKLDSPVEFSTDVIWVPSFMEFWNVYQIWRKNPLTLLS